MNNFTDYIKYAKSVTEDSAKHVGWSSGLITLFTLSTTISVKQQCTLIGALYVSFHLPGDKGQMYKPITLLRVTVSPNGLHF